MTATDIDKAIEQLQRGIDDLMWSDHVECRSYPKKFLQDAATALRTAQADNAKLRAEVIEYMEQIKTLAAQAKDVSELLDKLRYTLL